VKNQATGGGSSATGRGEAGRAGPDVRSDLFAAVELADEGGVQVDLVSRVGRLYGRAIEAEARRVCEALGVDHAKLRIEDAGALDPVIGARVGSFRW
jgi:citrate lyase acyl carrier protein